MKLNYIIIPLVVLAVARTGGIFTSSGMEWYRTIVIPSWTPPGAVIGIVWTVLFVLAAASILLLWNTVDHTNRFWWIIGLFVLNAVLNVLWSFLFFNQHLIGIAIIEAFVLGCSVVALMILIYPITSIAAWMLAPYAGWVFFATYLTYSIWKLN